MEMGKNELILEVEPTEFINRVSERKAAIKDGSFFFFFFLLHE